MSGEAAAMTRTWKVGKRKVTMTAPILRNGQVSFASMEWEPDAPSRLSKKETRQYQRGRDAAFEKLFGDHGMNGLMIDL